MSEQKDLEKLEKIARLLTDDPSIHLQEISNNGYRKAGRGILYVEVKFMFLGGYSIKSIEYTSQQNIDLGFAKLDARFRRFLKEIVDEYPPIQGYALAVISGNARYASIIA